jgi:DNA modification methylase
MKPKVVIHEQEYELVPVGDIRPHPKNPRQGDVAAIVASIQANQFYGACTVQRSTGYILAGNHRWLAARECELTHIPVIWVDCDDATAVRILLVDNRTNDLASYDDPKLAEMLSDILREQGTLDGTGYDGGALDALLAELGQTAGTEGLTEDDAAPEVPEVALTRPGDLWRCGAHLVLCGDSTKPDAVRRLMGADKADLVFTDPPYNVDYEGYTEEKLKIQGDKMTPEQFQEFLVSVFSSYLWALKPGGSMYVCHPSSWQREFQGAIEAADFEVRCQIIWAKNTFAWGFGRYKFQHEPIFYCHRTGQSDPWYGDKSQSTLWQEKKPSANRLHPTMKPVELIERALLNSSKVGDLVLDLFGGSGSTMIAAEKNDRSCRLMELDPKYCDVIVERWQDFTGKAAHLEDGRTFAELEAMHQTKRAA